MPRSCNSLIYRDKFGPLKGIIMLTALWWGRSDPDYSRNRILLKLFSDLDWRVNFFHPAVSQAGIVEAWLLHFKKPDLIWVPCFRQKDISSAAFWAKRWNVPLVIDPLISAYEKDVFEKEKWHPDSRKSSRRRSWEAALFSKADVVVADTPAHAMYYKTVLDVNPNRLCVLYVGAEAGLFSSRPAPVPQDPFEVLFFGSFLPLQGADVIVKAAHKTSDYNINWVLLGEGDLKSSIQKKSKRIANIFFEPWIDYDKLPDRLARAHVLLGIFGTTLKSELVIPNKMFQSMAIGRPVITRRAKAYQGTLEGSDVIGWIDGGDSSALANLVQKWLKEPTKLDARGKETRKLFDSFFSEDKMTEMLENVLSKALDTKKK